MAFARALLLSSLLLAPAVQGQNFGGSSRDDDAFSYIQPENTTILTQYGSSPPVYPSRKFGT
jgi:beta-glucosidase